MIGHDGHAIDSGPIAAELEHRPEEIDHEHADVTGGWLRPAVFGAMDGLVSNFALIAGVAGGIGGDHSTQVVLAGLAGLAAGAFSMAAGEYTSVASQAEYTEQEIEVERREIQPSRARSRPSSRRCTSTAASTATSPTTIAEQVHADPELALEVHAREELGVDPDHLPVTDGGGGVVVRLLRGRCRAPRAALPARRRHAVAGAGHQPASRCSPAAPSSPA